MKLADLLTAPKPIALSTLDKDADLVKDIQQALNNSGYAAGPVDGIYGPQTDSAIKQFCKDVHLNNADTGIFGASFAKALTTQPKALITMQQATQVFGNVPTPAQLADLNRCLVRFKINTFDRMTHFLAQVGCESEGLKYTQEIGDYDYFTENYEGRKDLGNDYPGDGAKFAGAGVIQLTGRANYQAFADYIGDQRVMEGCQYVAETYPFTSAGWFWVTNGLNDLCDQGATVATITKVVNGGMNGYNDRLYYYNRACSALKK